MAETTELFMATKVVPYEIELGGKTKRQHYRAGRIVDRAVFTEKGRFDLLVQRGSIVSVKEDDVAALALRYAKPGSAARTTDATVKGSLMPGSDTVIEAGGQAKGKKK